MFKFDFQDEGSEDESENFRENECGGVCAAAIEVYVTEEHISKIEKGPAVNTFNCGVFQIKHIQTDLENVEDTNVRDAELQHSDLIPGQYEGGFKIWECTYDLAAFMVKDISHIFHSGVRVLDLGCGAGILGILAFLHGCAVDFQDYNESVLNVLTIPNYLLNMNKDDKKDKRQKCRFFAGDWLSFVDLTRSENLLYDIILTSETVYNTDSYCKLHTVFKEKLKTTGSIFVAAKTCYFGVGGSLRLFEHFLSEKRSFTSFSCWTSNEGVQREILQLKLTIN